MFAGESLGRERVIVRVDEGLSCREAARRLRIPATSAVRPVERGRSVGPLRVRAGILALKLVKRPARLRRLAPQQKMRPGNFPQRLEGNRISGHRARRGASSANSSHDD